MKNHKNNIEKAVTTLEETVNNYNIGFDISSLRKQIEKKLNNLRPVIAVYGAYNAGKSTMVNAIFGKEISEVGNIPTTCETKKFNWNGWTIYDTPGIDAPVEHQEIADSALQESEVVLFVVSKAGDLECRDIFIKIADIADANKKIIVVFNDKTGNSASIGDMLFKITANLQKVWEERNISVNIPSIIMINADSALRGKIEKKALLVQKSNIAQLEHAVEKSVRKVNEEDILNNIITSLLLPAVEDVRQELTTENLSKEIMKLDDMRSTLIAEQSDMRFRAERLVDTQLINTGNELRTILSGQNITNDDIKTYINSAQSRIISQISAFFENELSRVQKGWDKNILEFAECINDNSTISAGLIPVNGSDQQTNRASEIAENILAQAKIIPEEKIAEITAPLLKDLFLKLREWKLAPFFRKWESTLGKWAGTAGKIVGKAAPWIIAGLEAGLSFREQHKYEKAIEAQAQSIETYITSLKFDMKSAYMELINSIIDEITKEQLVFIDDLLGQHKKDEAAVVDASEKLTDIKNKLQNIQLEFGKSA
jgi:GTPase SAR1 family protein